MKKDYMKPEMEIIEMESIVMTQTSIGIGDEAVDDELPGEAKGSEFRFNIWE